MILTEEETEETAETEKAITDIAVDPYYVLMGFAARAAADNTIAYPTMTPAAYAKTDSRFTVIRPEKFTLNGEYEFCARVLYSGKAYEKQDYTTKVTAFGPWDNKEMGDWAKRIAAGNAQLQNAYKNSGILHTARITDDSGKENSAHGTGMSVPIKGRLSMQKLLFQIIRYISRVPDRGLEYWGCRKTALEFLRKKHQQCHTAHRIL